jgi:hypothetical protein
LAWTVGHCAWVGACNARLCCDGTRCCDHCRAALVHVVELLTVAGCFALDLKLGSHRRNAGTAHRRDLSWLGSYGDSASAPVIGDAIVDDGRVVDDDRAVVDMGDVDVDAVDGAVVVEVISVPIAAVITAAGVTKAVVNSAVEADVRTPVAGVKKEAAVAPSPIAGGPKEADFGRFDPGAGHPVIVGDIVVIGPIAGRPDIAIAGADGLLVNRKRRRADADGDADLREGG